MSDLADIIVVNVDVQNPGVTQTGFGTPGILSYSVSWAERSRTYAALSEVDDDFATTTPEYKAAQKVFSQDPAPEEIKILRGALPPTQRYAVGVFNVLAADVYAMSIAYQNGTAQTASYTAAASVAWVALTVYSTTGTLVTNDSGKGYVLITAGTAAGSGGPTGTAADITDGTAHWMYVGTIAVGVASNDAIVYNLKKLIDLFATPTLAVTTSLQGSAGSKTLRILANAAATFYDVSIASLARLTIAQDHADPGVATDLAAIRTEDQDWYALVTLFNSEALVDAAAAWAETETLIYIADSCDSQIPQVVNGSATDTAHDVKAAAYDRTHVMYHPIPGEFAAAAMCGVFLPKSPGSETWRLKPLDGVTPQAYTSTHKTNMRAKNASWYYTMGAGGVVGGDAKMGSGQYIDVTRGSDWFGARTQERLANLLIQNDKIPFTDNGIGLIEAELRAQCLEGVRVKFIAEDTWTVTVPKAADISSADKAARELNDVYVDFTLAGAVHKVTVNVQISA